MPDIAHEHQAAPRQPQRLAVGPRVTSIGIEAAFHRAAALLEMRRQRAAHQAEPVAVRVHLVVGVDRGNGIFEVLDGGDGGFHHHVGDAGGVVAADRMGADDDPMAVTDPAGRVRGVAGLRVTDASIFPVVPCANTNFPVLMTAEKVADAILAGA